MTRRILFLTLLALVQLTPIPVKAQTLNENSNWPGKGELFVGANYQPVDRSPSQVKLDIGLMKKAGFNIVRIGDLSWDAFEPEDGKFTFDHFDAVMDQMHAAGIKVILDIPGQPAPLWLHRKYPGVTLVAQNGTVLHPAERYMDNISDPDYRRLVVRLADKLTSHYAQHPALFAIGYNNEIGNGFMSYSKADRQRFITWLKNKYHDLDTLNKAWATQRWSRRISHWDEVQIPYVDGPGPFERYLDLRRYWSDAAIAVLQDLDAVRQKNVPDKPAASNLWDSSERRGFDYLSSYRQYVNYGAMGYYAGDPISGGFETLMMKGALPTPIWFVEFTAGGGGYYGNPGRSRMWAYFGLINGVQSILAWTFNSHIGGEEQALFGLIDHDDTPSWKLDEFATIASEFRQLQSLGFPRELKPSIAIAYSFEARMASHPRGPSNTVRQYITTGYMEQIYNAYAGFLKDNVDIAVINVGHEDLSRYKMIVVPGLYLLDEASAENLRKFVGDGGTVVMTAFSAKVNEHNQWFNTTLPGRLNDVFGIKTNEFYRRGTALKGNIGKQVITTSIDFFEVLEPSTAEVLGRFSNVDNAPPLITQNQYGKGKAIYVATPAQESVLRPLYHMLYASLDIAQGPLTPEGVYARVVDGRTLYVNTTTETREVTFNGIRIGKLSGKKYKGKMILEPWGAELLE